MARFIGKKNNGFEIGWQMVPLKGQKDIELLGGAGLNVVDGGAFKKVIELKEITRGKSKGASRKFTIKGFKKGKTVLWAKKGNKIVTQMVVQVIPQRIVSIAFNYVSDNTGKTTKRSPKTAGSLLKKINEIYLPQANVKFQMVKADTCKINAKIGKEFVRDPKTPAKDTFSLLVANRVPKAQINVFFVWECQKEGIDDDIGGVAEIAISKNQKTNCMVEDNLGSSFPRTVAHEIGHNLGLKDDYYTPNLLMYGISDSNLGTHLCKSEIEQIMTV